MKRSMTSTFLSCEKDVENIIRKLFVEDGYDEDRERYSTKLKKLLIINSKDCLDNPAYTAEVNKYKMSDIIGKYIRLTPLFERKEHDEVKTYIVINMDNFLTNATNEYYRDCTISFDIICPAEQWELGDYRIRPLKIAGYIDGILHNAKLSGIGLLDFVGCAQLPMNEEFGGYTLIYRAIHGSLSDDRIPNGR